MKFRASSNKRNSAHRTRAGLGAAFTHRTRSWAVRWQPHVSEVSLLPETSSSSPVLLRSNLTRYNRFTPPFPIYLSTSSLRRSCAPVKKTQISALLRPLTLSLFFFFITFLLAGNIVSFCCGAKWLPSTGKAKTTTNTRKTFSRTMLWNLRFAPAQRWTAPSPSTWFYSWLFWLAVPSDCGSVSSNTKL